MVATVLTVYGIETGKKLRAAIVTYKVATVLTVYGIETTQKEESVISIAAPVATVLTVYGIETQRRFRLVAMAFFSCCNSTYRLRY